MQIVKISDIHISPDRQRKDFDPMALSELSETIKSKGLLHAIVVRQAKDGKLTLVAGERRMRAIQDMWMLGGDLRFNNEPVQEGYLPYVTLGQLSPLEAEEAELEENLHRKDLTWQENAAAMSRLHRLRSAQAQAQGRIHTVADTALETKGRSDGYYQESVRQDLIVAKHLDNPLVAKAKSTQEAFKILKRQEQVQKNVELAKSVGATFSSAVHKVINADCISWMAAADPEQFDVICTDPPYGMGAHIFGDSGGKLNNFTHHYDDSYESWKKLMEQWCPLSYKVAKAQAHAYVFCDIENFAELKQMMKAAGWYVFRTPMINTKTDSGRVPLPDEGPRRQYEILLYAIKGHKKTTAIYSDVITTMADSGLLHGAQKPVSLYENLLLRSVRAGDKVADFFGGSGPLLNAAHRLKCAATVIEQNPEYYGICLKRLQDLDAIEAQIANQGSALSSELASLVGGKR